jgi:hypothetical protein
MLSCQFVFGQPELDSIIHQRNYVQTEYRLLDESPGKKTWTKMAEINSSAKELIKIDNALIDYYLYKAIEKNNSLKDQLDNLTLEITLLKKEYELQSSTIEENESQVNILLILIGGLFLFFIVVLVMFIDRQIRFRSIKLELERTWPIREEFKQDGNLLQDINQLSKQVGELTLKNSALTSELTEIRENNREKEKLLEKEIQTKKLIEEEIKQLILQLKSK